MPSLLLAALLTLLFFELPVAAQGQDDAPATHLTSRGRFMVSGQISGVWSNDSPALYGSNDTWTVRASPSLVYFLRENLGLGATVSAGTERGDLFPRGSYRSNEIGLGCELVWNVPIRARWSFMVRPFIGYTRAWSNIVTPFTVDAVSSASVDVERVSNYVRLASSFPLVYALSDAIGLGIGPDFLFDMMFAQRVDPHVVEGPSIVAARYASGGTRAQLGASVGLYASF